MEIIYRADDGTEFYDEDDCERYEEKQRLNEMNLTSRFWDRTGHPLLIEDLAGTVEHAYYAELTTDEEAAFIDGYVYEKVGGGIFENEEDAKAGRYYFDTYHEVWKNIEELNKKYKEVLAVFGEGK